MVEAVLTVEPVNHTALDRLYNNYTTVEVGLLVHVPDDPINKCAEEVTFAKLDNLFRHHALRSEFRV